MKKLLTLGMLLVLFSTLSVNKALAQIGQQFTYTITDFRNLEAFTNTSKFSLRNPLIDNAATTVPSGTSWKGDYCFDYTNGTLALKLRSDLGDPSTTLHNTPIPETFTCSVVVLLTAWVEHTSGNGTLTATAPQSHTLQVTYDKRKGLQYKESDIRVVNGAHYLEAQLISVSNESVRKYLQLQLNLETRKQVCLGSFDVSPAPPIAALEYLPESNEFRLTLLGDNDPNGGLLKQADEFDIEYTFVDEFDKASDFKQPFVDILVNYKKFSFEDNATRITVGKNQRELRVKNVFEPGYLLFRYRTVGYYEDKTSGNTLRLEGQWSTVFNSNSYFSTGGHEYLPHDYTNYTNMVVKIPQNNSTDPLAVNEKAYLQNLNWQYVSVFAEENKRKETLTFYDGSMRARQNIATNNSDNTALVQENVYDYLGRPAIQVLPVPIAYEPNQGGLLRYYPGLNRNTNNNNAIYSAADFDVHVSGACSSPTGAMQTNTTQKGASNYYSINNPYKKTDINDWDYNKYIPVANGFPFTQTLYLNDNSGRVAAQTGVGSKHQLDGKATRYLYATPFQEELTRLFGTNVGFNQHYKKNVVIDANGQASVSFVDLKGKTIATALSANPSASTTTNIASNIARNNVEVNLLGDGEVQYKETELVFSKVFLVQETGPVKLKYSVLPQKYNTELCPTNGCFDGVYDLEIAIYNQCGDNLFDGDQTNAAGQPLALFKRTIGGGENPETVNDNRTCLTTVEYNFESDAKLTTDGDGYITLTNLPPGAYTVTRKLQLNEKAYQAAEAHFLANSACSTQTQFENAALSQMDMSGCYPDCASCTQFNAIPLDTFLKGVVDLRMRQEYTEFYNAKKQRCKELACNERSACDVIKDILRADVTPGGQYATYEYEVNATTGLLNATPTLAGTINVLNDANTASYNSFPNSYTVLLPGATSPVAVNSLTPKQFIENWRPEWADLLIQYHPEFCELTWCEGKRTYYDEEITIMAKETYQQAYDAHYIHHSPVTPFILNTGTDLFFQVATHGNNFYQNLYDYHERSFTENGATSTVSLSVDQLVLYSIFYPENAANPAPTKAEFESRIAISNLKNKLDLCSGAYKNLYWNTVKGLYIAERRKLLDEWKIATTGVGPGNCNPTIPAGKDRRFYNYNTPWPDPIGGSQMPIQPTIQTQEIDAIKATVETEILNECSTQCDSYEPIWRENLKNCNLSEASMNNIIASLKQVCRDGCDINFPMGASSVAPGKLNTSANVSFEQIMRTAQENGKFIYDKELCSDLLITMPRSYGHDYFATASPYADTCYNPQGIPCAGSTASSATNTAAKLLAADVPESGKCQNCVDCSQTANAFYDYSRFNPLDFAQKSKTEEDIVRYLNRRLGMNLSFDDYEQHLAKCIGYKTFPTNVNIFKTYAQTYGIVVTKSLKELSLMAQNEVKPLANPYQYSNSILEERAVYTNNYANAPLIIATSESKLGAQMLLSAPPANPFFDDVSDDNMYNYLDCLCDDILSQQNPIAYLTNGNGPALIKDIDGGSASQFLQQVVNTCQTYKNLKDACRDNIVFPAQYDWLNQLQAENGEINYLGYSDDPILNEYLWDYYNGCNIRAKQLMKDLLKAAPLEIDPNNNYLKELNCCELADSPEECTGTGGGTGGGGSGGISVDACLQIMPVFVTYYNNNIKALFEPTLIKTKELKIYLINDLSDALYNGVIAAVNGAGANIPTTNITRQEQMDLLWQILTLCNQASCEQFITLASSYDNTYASAIQSVGPSLYNLAAGASTQKVYTDFRELLNTNMNKPPFITHFNDEKVVKFFRSCSKSSCEVVVNKLNDLQTAQPTLFSESGHSLVETLRKTDNVTTVNTLVNDVNTLLARAPYFIPVDQQSIFGAIEMCWSCRPAGQEYDQFFIEKVVEELFSPVFNPTTGQQISVMSRVLIPQWKMRNQGNILISYYARNAYKNNITYNVTKRAINNSYLFGEGRTPNGNYFYIKINTLKNRGANLFDYQVGDPIPGFSLTMLINSKVTDYKIVKFSPFEVELTAKVKFTDHNQTDFFQHILITLPAYPFYNDYLTNQSCKHNYTVCNKPINEFTVTVDEDPCTKRLKMIAKANGLNAYLRYKQGLIDKFRQEYVATTMNRTALREVMQLKYTDRQYHYTLYYYDQAGNLVKTVPPAGVKPLRNSSQIAAADNARNSGTNYFTAEQHQKVTDYVYNTLNQLVEQTTPDAGKSEFWHDAVGRVVLSRNAKQNAQTPKQLSYTIYDGLGRIKEVGQLTGDGSAFSDVNHAAIRQVGNMDEWLSSLIAGDVMRSQITRTYYDYWQGTALNTATLANDFSNLRGRVVHTAFFETETQTPQSAVHYSYDVHGNVKKLYREVPALAPLGQQLKQVDYKYDLISGKVNEVIYQRGEADQFIHQYRYDAENRITSVLTGTNYLTLEEDANYHYYKHGPLARTELGKHHVQGLDYTYTIQGWLKAVNAPTLNPERDPGRDGFAAVVANKHNARDVVGFELSYFNDDYEPTYTFTAAQAHTTSVAGATGIIGTANTVGAAPELFNGNIRYMTTGIETFNTQLSAYKYDQLNRIVAANYFTDLNTATNTWSAAGPVNQYYNEFEYDADGNIMRQIRKGEAGNTDMDDLTYNYVSGKNQLAYVDDAITNKALYADDIDDQVTGNYEYDAIGNLTKDVAEEIAEIKWNVYGKITNIIRVNGSTKPDLIFTYTPDGHRLSKTVISKSQPYSTTTYYVRDAQGNIMATYKRSVEKIIDYSSLNYAAVNDKLYELLGANESARATAFGNFIGNLHSTHVNNTGFNNAMLTQFNANTAPSHETRLREMNPVHVLNGGSAYLSWLLMNLDEQTVATDIVGSEDGNSIGNLCNCSGTTMDFTEYIAAKPELTLAYFKALCAADEVNSTNVANNLANAIGLPQAYPENSTFENALLAHLNHSNANVHNNSANVVSKINNMGLNDCNSYQEVFNQLLNHSDPTVVQQYYNVVAYHPDSRFRARLNSLNACSTTVNMTSLLQSSYAESFLRAIYRWDESKFQDLLTAASITYTNVDDGVSDLMALDVATLITHLNTVSITFGNSNFNSVLLYMYLMDAANLNNMLEQSFFNPQYGHTCISTSAYKCADRIGNKTTDLVNHFGNTTVWDKLLALNYGGTTVDDRVDHLAEVVKTTNIQHFLSIAAKYQKTEISTYQQANNLYEGTTNGMEQYFAHMQNLLPATVYQGMINHFMGASATYKDVFTLNEWNLYGSSRLGVQQANVVIATAQYTATYTNGQFTNVTYNNSLLYEMPVSTTELVVERGRKAYELSNHLGNVLATISDKKVPNYGTTLFKADFSSTVESFVNDDQVAPTSVVLENGRLKVTGTANFSGVKRGIATTQTLLISGKVYTVKFAVATGTNLIASIKNGSTLASLSVVGNSSYNPLNPSLVNYSLSFTANGSSAEFVIVKNNSAGTSTTFYLDDVEAIYPSNFSHYTAEVMSATDYSPFGAPLPGRTYQQGKFDAKVVNMPVGSINSITGWTKIFCNSSGCTPGTSLVNLSTVSGKLMMQTSTRYAQAYYTFTTIPGRVYKVKYRLSGVTFGLTNTSIFAPAQPKELYTSANMSIAMVNNVDREMIFTATEASVRFYITRGWAPGQTTPAEEVYLDYLNITEVPSQVNTISCTSINENMVMLANSGVVMTNFTAVANALNAYYNRNYTYTEYQAILNHCTDLPASYVLAKEGAEAASVKASYAFGFNGKESDNEVSGIGNQYDYGMRIYNPRLGRFLSVDPLTKNYSMLTPYQFASNSPVSGIDLDGLEYLFYVYSFKAGQKDPQIEVKWYNESQCNQHGPAGMGVMYVSKFYNKAGKLIYRTQQMVRRDQELPWYGKAIADFNYKDYGNYRGPSSLYKWTGTGFTGNYDYSVPAVDAVDEAAKNHDQAYDAIGAVGQNSLENDWGTMPADIAAVSSWQQIVNLGVGAIDPFNGQRITQAEIDAANDGITYFNMQINSKIGDISSFMEKNYSNLSAGMGKQSHYNLFLQIYMEKNEQGTYTRKEGMWNYNQEDKSWTPVSPESE